MGNLPGEGGKGRGKWRVNVIKAQNKINAEPAVQAYDAQLVEVLRTRNVFRFRNFLAASGRALPDDMMLDTLKMATLMHQLTLTMPELAEMHSFSRQWLDENTVLTSKNPSLNEAARRAPGTAADQPPESPPVPGRRTINLRQVPVRNPHRN